MTTSILEEQSLHQQPADEQFMTLLPRIRHFAVLAFRDLGEEERDDMIAETVANANCAFARLVERGMSHVIGSNNVWHKDNNDG